MDRGTARLLIVVALAVVGGLVLANGFDSSAVPNAAGSPGATPSNTDTPTPTDTSTAPPPDTVEPQPPGDVQFMSLNGTSVSGAGAAAQTDMEAAGYKVAKQAADSPVQGVQTTTVLYRQGETEDETAQNEANAKQIAKKVFKGAEVDKLSKDYDDLVPPEATIVILVGLDFAEECCTT